MILLSTAAALGQTLANPSLDATSPTEIPNTLQTPDWTNLAGTDVGQVKVPIDCASILGIDSSDGGQFARALSYPDGAGRVDQGLTAVVEDLVPGVQYLVQFETSLVRHYGQSTGHWTVTFAGDTADGPDLSLPAGNPEQGPWLGVEVGPFTATAAEETLYLVARSNDDGTTSSPFLPVAGCVYFSEVLAVDLLLDGVSIVGDPDFDGVFDDMEAELGTDPSNPDSDFDGLLDGEELEWQTDPTQVDTDGDGSGDGLEVAGGFDPLDPESHPEEDTVVITTHDTGSPDTGLQTRALEDPKPVGGVGCQCGSGAPPRGLVALALIAAWARRRRALATALFALGVGCDSTKAADRDGDGSTDTADCAPDDPEVHAGADESCNDLDDDCDGVADDVDPNGSSGNLLYGDADGDGHGDAEDPRRTCVEELPGYARVGDDCDDAAPQTYPGAPELCGDADEDCDPATGGAGIAFLGMKGNWVDYTTELGAGTALDPKLAVVADPGTLYICAGEWYLSLELRAEVQVVGVAGSALTSIYGGHVRPGLVVQEPHVVSVEGLSFRDFGPVDFGDGVFGGGLVCANDASIVAADVTFVGGTAGDDLVYGGIVSAVDGCSLQVEGATFEGGVGTLGGQVYVDDADAQFTNATFSGGEAAFGGAMFLGNDQNSADALPATRRAFVACTDCTFDGLTAFRVGQSGGTGAAIALFGDAELSLSSGAFLDNAAGLQGGAIALYDGAQVLDTTLPRATLTDASFDGNTAVNEPNDVRIIADDGTTRDYRYDGQTVSVVCEPALGCQ